MTSTIAIDFSDILNTLEKDFGQNGLNYLISQVNITKESRNIVKNLLDERLISAQFLLILNLIETWIAPLAEILNTMEEDEIKLRELQEEARFVLQKTKISSWQQAMTNPELHQVFDELHTLKTRMEAEREQIFAEAKRSTITQLLGMILFPYSGHKTLLEAIKYAEERYYGPNVKYRKLDKYCDAIILMNGAQEIYQRKEMTIDTNDQEIVSYEKYFNDPDSNIQKVESIYLEAKNGNFTSKGFTFRDINVLVSKILRRTTGLAPDERTMFQNPPYYLQSVDQIKADLVMQWIESQLTEKTRVIIPKKLPKIDAPVDKSAKKYLFGLSFLDKHVNNEILGNISETSFTFMERVLGPFVELKQDQIYMESTQFEIKAMDLPDQAWIYDFTSVKTEILRSTMLLISDRQPKFDLLESCQMLVNAILSGRVDRNDLRTEKNYIYTGLLPKESWDFVGKTLMQILKEALIDEDMRARRIVQKVFAEEDRSHLVSSKKFNPAFYIEMTWKIYERKSTERDAPIPTPENISVWKTKEFDFQYRHTKASGYPWYYNEGSILRDLVEDSMMVTYLLFKEVLLNRAIYTIDKQKFIFYFQPNETLDKLQVLVFKEAGEFEEGISPVEVLFRPKKFIDRTPEQNNLYPLIQNARANDPKDLETLISNINQ